MTNPTDTGGENPTIRDVRPPSDTAGCVCSPHVVDHREWLLTAYPWFGGPNKLTIGLPQKFSCAHAMTLFRRFRLLCILTRR